MHFIKNVFERLRNKNFKFGGSLINRVTNVFTSSCGFIKAYLEQSSIHGFSYIVREQLTWLENAFWFLLVLVAFIGCVIISLQSIHRYETKSTMMGLECDYTYWNTTLPSLTICPTERLSRNLFDKFCNVHNIEDIAIKKKLFQYLETLANATFFNMKLMPENHLAESILRNLDIEPKNYMKLIYNLTDDLSMTPDIGQRVAVTDGPLPVRQILTELGICYTTNTYLIHKYSTSYFVYGKYPKPPIELKNKKYIPMIQGNYFDSESLYTFNGFNTSFVSYVHSPHETMRVDINRNYVFLGIEYLTEMHEIIAEENVEKQTTPEQRNCRFQHETNLTHFPLYTKNLCTQQCRLDLCMHICKCIPHFYPNRIRSPKPVCSYDQLRTCVADNVDNLIKLYDNSTKKFWPCNCVPNCQDSVLTVLNTAIRDEYRFYPSNFGYVRTLNWPLYRYKRQIIFSFTDLLVSIGGTAGLFLGFSVLGAVEFCYFFTMHLMFCIFYRSD